MLHVTPNEKNFKVKKHLNNLLTRFYSNMITGENDHVQI